MSYQIVVSPTGARQLQERLPEAVAWACYEFIRGPLAEEPRRVGAALRTPFEGCWRARRGEYSGAAVLGVANHDPVAVRNLYAVCLAWMRHLEPGPLG